MSNDREHAEAMLDDYVANPENWEIVEEVPRAPSGHRPKVTVALRLDREVLEKVRALAAREGLGYTTLLRNWVEERLTEGPSNARPPAVTVSPQTLARWHQVANRAAEALRLDIDSCAGTVEGLRAYSDLSQDLARLVEEAGHLWLNQQEIRFKDRMQDILELAMLRRVGVGLQQV